jgi:multiple antibiotic resistance protein
MSFENFWDVFIPFFIAFDPIGLLPVYVSLTYSYKAEEIRQISAVATLVALVICLFFGFFGRYLLSKLGITISDFQISGGLLLIVFSILDLLTSDKARRRPESFVQVAVVPIAMPLLVGPAVLTALLLSINEYGSQLTFLALSLNLLLVFILFYFSKSIIQIIGQTGAKGVGKFFSVILCAFGVMLVRKGIFSLLGI